MRSARSSRTPSLAARSIPWAPLARLFGGFAGIRGVGFSKMTKALHKKRPALIPMLDSVVQAYLDEPPQPEGSFGQQAIALVRAYKVRARPKPRCSA